jgi:hypothetical protein
MRNNTPRDKQFRDGFARLLFGDLMMMDALNYNCNFVDIEQHLARRGYDFATHVALETSHLASDHVPFYYGEDDAVRGISDMAEWPKESESE